MKLSKIKLAAILTLTCTVGVTRADPEELFPNVTTYDDKVASPISKPEVKRTSSLSTTPPAPTPAPAPAPEVVTPAPTPAPAPTPSPIDNPPAPADPNRPRPPRKNHPTTQPLTQPVTQPASQPAAPAAPLVEFTPYAEALMKPMLSAEDGKAFDDGFADAITKSLAGTPEQRKKTADLLESSAESITSPDLKRYLMVNAFALYIRAGISAKDRETKALALLPLLTEKTLPVIQARADALNDLLDRAATAPSNAFYDVYMDAFVRLTKYRVQTGYPHEAFDSLKKAREAALHYVNKPKVRSDELMEASAWYDRANQATALAPKYQEMLKANPSDPVANTMMATLHLSLYGNLDNAAVFAAKSDRKDLQQFAAVIKDNPPHNLSKDPAKHAEQVLAIGQALVEVAKATSTGQMFDRYSIACYAGDHVSQVIEDGAMPQAKVLDAKVMLATAKEIIDKSMLKRGEDLPKWLGGGGSNLASVDPSKRNITCFNDIFHGLPKDLQPADTGWTPGQMQKVNDWFAKNYAGQTFNAQVFADRLDPPRDGPNGKVYVPFICRFQNTNLSTSLIIETYIEIHATPEMAKRANQLSHEQVIDIKGTMSSVVLTPWTSFPNEPKEVKVTIVVTPAEGK